ncbi:hypothetical protein ACFSVJ_24310 [Prauserella oleivorans]
MGALAPEVSALTSVVDHHPELRERLAQGRHSHEKADATTSRFSALAQGLSGGGESAFLDAVKRAAQIREARAHERAWCAAESSLVTGPETAAAESCAIERPMPLPEGQVEEYERRVLTLGAAAGAVAVPFAGPRRALALGLSSVPKAAESGRSAFASAVGTILARRGVLVMDRAALRKLDRIDTLVLDHSALETGRAMLRDLVPLPDSDQHAVAEVAWRLFDPAHPKQVQTDGSWRLGPLDELDTAAPRLRRPPGAPRPPSPSTAPGWSGRARPGCSAWRRTAGCRLCSRSRASRCRASTP